MEHSFDIEIASEYGVNSAIILKHIYFWVEKNEANERHLHEGHYWTYNSVKAFTELFPYMSRDQINTALKKLRENGLILEGQFNDAVFDRTKWYTLTEKGKAIIEKSEMHFGKSVNGLTKNPKPIPDIKPYIWVNNNNLNNFNYLKDKGNYKDIGYLTNNTTLVNSVREWMEYKDGKKPKSSNHYDTERGMCKFLTIVIKADKQYGTDAVVEAIDKAIANNWMGIAWDGLSKSTKKKSTLQDDLKMIDEWGRS